MKLALFLVFLIVIPVAFAKEQANDLGIIDSLMQAIKNFIVEILSSPIQPLVNLVKSLITEPVNLDLFKRLWEIIVYIISIFYGLILFIAGFNFITSSYDIIKREKAKEWLRNSILMIIFVNISFILYKLLVDISSIINNGMFSLVNNNLFLITIDNPSNFGLEVILMAVYIIVLLLTIVLLGIRYLLVSIGLVLFPIGLAFNFFNPLKSYGKLILNLVITTIFIPIIFSIILLVCSKLLEIGFLSNFKIIITILAFSLIIIVMIIIAIFVVMKSIFGLVRSDVMQGVNLIANKM